MSKYDKQTQTQATRVDTTPAPSSVRLNYGEWLTLRKHAVFQPVMVSAPGSMIPTLMAKGLVNPKDLKITPLGERELANYTRQANDVARVTEPFSGQVFK